MANTPKKPRRKRTLRRRVVTHPLVQRSVAGLFAGYLRLCHATTRWQKQGFEPLRATLAEGKPVIMLLWHERITMTPWMFDLKAGRIFSLTSDAAAGRLAGQVQAVFGFGTVAMSSRRSNVAISREVLRQMKDGVSIGIAGDGPRGPVRALKSVPLEWARITGAPIFMVTFAAKPVRRLSTWDRMFVPLPFARGIIRIKRWEETVPRRLDPDAMAALRDKLEHDLSALTDETDTELLGHPAR